MASRPTRLPLVQDFPLIWLDSSIDENNDDCQQALSRLRRVVNTINTYTQPNDCIAFINEHPDENVLIIVSGWLGMEFVPSIHDMGQVDSIFIFCGNKPKHEQWANKWSKVKGVFTDIQSLCEILQQQTRLGDRDSTAITITSARNTDELEPTFMYTSLFRECILDIHYDDAEISKLASECRALYAENLQELEIIDEFENTFYMHSPIWWYTRECFIYHLLNRALRTFETSVIVMMGFFIQALHRRIEQLHSEQRLLFGKEFVVYRGQGLLETSFDKLQASNGGLLSFNNFLSTSENRDVSLSFAQLALDRVQHVAVLFVIRMHPSIPSSPFAQITADDGYYQQEEQEVLFSTNSIFRIGTIAKLHETKPFYEVQLTLTANDDAQLLNLTESTRADISGGTGLHQLGKLLLKAGDPQRAGALYHKLLQDTPSEKGIEVGFMHHQLGRVYADMGEYSAALDYHKKALEINEAVLPPMHSNLAAGYSNIGQVYSDMGEYSKTLDYYEKAHRIFEQILPPMHPNLAGSYNNIGVVYSNMGEYAKTLDYYKKALYITEKALPSTHPDLATSYNNIGGVYSDMGEYAKALDYYEKAHGIYEKALPPTHPVLAASCSHLGRLHRSMKDYGTALKYFEAALKICQEALSEKHPNLAITYANIGDVHRWMSDTETACMFLNKALHIQTSTTCDPVSLAWTYQYLGETHRVVKEYSLALEFHEKARKIREQFLPATHPALGQTQHCLARIHLEMKEYKVAYELAQHAVKIARQKLPAKHPDLVEYVETVSETEKKL